MKNLRLPAFILCTILWIACSKEPVCDIDCNLGTPTSLCSCDCPEGVEGDNCETLWRDKVLGEWKIESICEDTWTAFNYKVNIESDENDVTKFYIDWQNGQLNTLYMTSTTDMVMHKQVSCASCWEVFGDGHVKENGEIEFLLTNPLNDCHWKMFR